MTVWMSPLARSVPSDIRAPISTRSMSSQGDFPTKRNLIAILLALTVMSWAQSTTSTQTPAPDQKSAPADTKPGCSCCEKMSSADHSSMHKDMRHACTMMPRTERKRWLAVGAMTPKTPHPAVAKTQRRAAKMARRWPAAPKGSAPKVMKWPAAPRRTAMQRRTAAAAVTRAESMTITSTRPPATSI
jgi:hypothetical protein